MIWATCVGFLVTFSANVLASQDAGVTSGQFAISDINRAWKMSGTCHGLTIAADKSNAVVTAWGFYTRVVNSVQKTSPVIATLTIYDCPDRAQLKVVDWYNADLIYLDTALETMPSGK